ncbi:MAG: hypothetical protein HOO91_07105 [Bacteroidales bacterium]|nr:hypothetical protein [Bacteroidales bacterium]
MKNSLFLIIIILFLQNCSIPQNKKYIFNISKKYKDFDLLLVIPANNGSETVNVCISNTELFKNVFSAHYISEYNDFTNFIQSVINNKKSIDFNNLKELPYKIINPKAVVFDYYKEKGLNGLVGSYLNKEGNRFSSVYSISEDDKYGLIKIMFENHYYVSWNDYRACFVFTKELDSEDDQK